MVDQPQKDEGQKEEVSAYSDENVVHCIVSFDQNGVRHDLPNQPITGPGQSVAAISRDLLIFPINQ